MDRDDNIALRLLGLNRNDCDYVDYIRKWPNGDFRWSKIVKSLGSANARQWRSHAPGTVSIRGVDVKEAQSGGTRIVITTISNDGGAVWFQGKRYEMRSRVDFNELDFGDVLQPDHIRN